MILLLLNIILSAIKLTGNPYSTDYSPNYPEDQLLNFCKTMVPSDQILKLLTKKILAHPDTNMFLTDGDMNFKPKNATLSTAKKFFEKNRDEILRNFNDFFENRFIQNYFQSLFYRILPEEKREYISIYSKFIFTKLFAVALDLENFEWQHRGRRTAITEFIPNAKEKLIVLYNLILLQERENTNFIEGSWFSWFISWISNFN